MHRADCLLNIMPTPAHSVSLKQESQLPRLTDTGVVLCRVCIIAGDISPIDVITPLPVLCEDNDVPYVYVPSKEVQRELPALMLKCLSLHGVAF